MESGTGTWNQLYVGIIGLKYAKNMLACAKTIAPVPIAPISRLSVIYRNLGILAFSL